MTSPTERQSEVLRVVQDFTREHGYAPSFREIGRRCGIGSTNGVYEHLRALSRKGLITFAKGKARSIRIVGPEEDLRAQVARLEEENRRLRIEASGDQGEIDRLKVTLRAPCQRCELRRNEGRP